jgi:hypothetical protein
LGKSGLNGGRICSVQLRRRSAKVRLVVRIRCSVPVSSEAGRNSSINSTGILKETTSINECILASSLGRSSKGVDSIWKGINGISVVERLSTENFEKSGVTKKRRTVINVLIRLDNPDKLLNRVVKVELNLIRGRTDRLITSELKLANQILVRILGESAALISIKEDVINIEGSSNKRLIVCNNSSDRCRNVVLSRRVGTI